MADAWLKEGDDSPTLLSTLKDFEGVVVDLTGTTVALHVRPLRGGTPGFSDSATVLQVGDGSDGTLGDVGYVFNGPLDPDGYLYEWEVMFTGGAVETFPNDRWLKLAVVHELDEAAS